MPACAKVACAMACYNRPLAHVDYIMSVMFLPLIFSHPFSTHYYAPHLTYFHSSYKLYLEGFVAFQERNLFFSFDDVTLV